MSHDVRLVKTCEQNQLIDYLLTEWKSDHVFCTSPWLLEWQHKNKFNPSVINFIAAFDTDSNQINGVLGFIPTKRFDTNLADDVGLAIWKASDDQAGLGLQLFMFLKQKLKPRSIYAMGLSQQVLPIYHALNFNVGLLDQWVLINPQLKTLNLVQIIQVPPKMDKPVPNPKNHMTEWDVQQIKTHSDWINQIGKHAIPSKSCEYLLNRYAHHPTYEYQFWALHTDLSQNIDHPSGLLITRIVGDTEGNKALRGVDFLGEEQALNECENNLIQILVEKQYEYLDLYSCNLNLTLSDYSSFLNRAECPGLVVPNYFEPYLRKNVDLDFAYWTNPANKTARFNLYKGDTDQDRPNIIL